ncbi:hypothetical protein E3U55_07075 [Filobacillus milosensis]|uniref:Uncharacterized protein n=1 Tax=Filobacillus milosensis TaxID=94137 RepID=A0A4Y8IQ55_9BACI|nr:spore germination protein GerPC [Filobacillus milosensis]TFB22056.1 hypothetical protein E3U55_07075 [Filobacillus milosensis]
MEQSNTVWQQLAYLEQKINQQTQLIQELKDKIDELSEAQKQSSKSQVEKIEYNFEQLKIETLEGTLNIGLTPHKDLPFEQLDLPEESSEPVTTPMEQQIYNQLLPYIRKEVPKIINDFSNENDINISDEWRVILFQDLRKQLPNRIKQHIQNLNQDDRLIIDREQVTMLVNHIKKEISQGVTTYLNNTKENYDES